MERVEMIHLVKTMALLRDSLCDILVSEQR